MCILSSSVDYLRTFTARFIGKYVTALCTFVLTTVKNSGLCFIAYAANFPNSYAVL